VVDETPSSRVSQLSIGVSLQNAFQSKHLLANCKEQQAIDTAYERSVRG